MGRFREEVCESLWVCVYRDVVCRASRVGPRLERALTLWNLSAELWNKTRGNMRVSRADLLRRMLVTMPLASLNTLGTLYVRFDC